MPFASATPQAPASAGASPYIERLRKKLGDLNQQWRDQLPERTMAQLAGDTERVAEIDDCCRRFQETCSGLEREIAEHDLRQRVSHLLASGQAVPALIRKLAVSRRWKDCADLLQWTGEPAAAELAAEAIAMSGRCIYSEVWADAHQSLERRIVTFLDDLAQRDCDDYAGGFHDAA